ncbi:MAG: TraR/DksA family transcriptional regulator [Bacteroidales bacterium]|jgi:RNA polymerase-binding transcription factor DksA|nr:TraR/DksA family transcriptional regulator [Bacteroidales bacterium]
MAKQRYSDEELTEFRTILEGKLADAKKKLEWFTNTLRSSSENDINDTTPISKAFEDGYTTVTKEENAYFAQRESDYIKKLEQALDRIDKKTYGICVITNQLIPKERLLAVPTTTKTIEAKKTPKK